MSEKIVELLNGEIERTLKEVSEAKTGSDEAKAALIKLDKLHGQRVKELEAILKDKQLNDASIAKMDEAKTRETELELKSKQIEEELKLKVQQVSNDLEIKKAELERKDAELKEAKKSRRWHTFMEGLGIAVPIVATGYWMKKGLKFEEEGKIYSSRTSQWIGGIKRLFRMG